MTRIDRLKGQILKKLDRVLEAQGTGAGVFDLVESIKNAWYQKRIKSLKREILRKLERITAQGPAI